MLFIDHPQKSHYTIDALIDTGATHSLISRTFASELGLLADTKVIIQCINANGSLTKTQGIVLFPMCIDGIHLGTIDLHIYPDMNMDVLLGMDIIHFDSGKIRINVDGRLYNILPCTRRKQIIAERDIMILPGHSHRVTMAMNNYVVGKESHVVETISGESKFLDREDNEFEIWNDGEDPIMFAEGTQLASIKKAEQQGGSLGENDSLPRGSFQYKVSDNVEPYTLVDINKNLPQEVQNKYTALTKEYKDIFATSVSDLGEYAGPEKYKVNLTTQRPQKGMMFPIPKSLEKDYISTIKELLDNGLIEETQDTKYDHGVIAVKKKDKTTRWVHDMRGMNAVMEEDSYPLPNLEQLLMHMRGSKVYSKLDLLSFFHQFKIDEEQRKYYAWTCPVTGLRYQWVVCCFGSRNLSSFVSYVMRTRVFRGKPIEEASTFIDDVTCYNNSHTEMISNLRDSFERIRSFNLKLKPAKCELGYSTIAQFGYKINEQGMSMDPERVEKFNTIKEPTTRKQLHSALGAANYYRNVTPSIAKPMSALTPLLSLKRPFIWTEECALAWHALMKALADGVILTKPDFDATWIVKSDASEQYFGGTLCQRTNGEERIIAVHSATFPEGKRMWSIHLKELEGVVALIRKWKQFLIGRKFELVIDNQWVYYILKNPYNVLYTKTNPTVRALIFLATFDFELILVKGTDKCFQLADLLSRRNDGKVMINPKSVGDLLIPVPTGMISRVIPVFTSPSELSQLVLRHQRASGVKPILQAEYSARKDFEEGDDGLRLGGRLIVPDGVIPEILRLTHRHIGGRRQYELLRNAGLHWKNMERDVITFTRGCEICSQVKSLSQPEDFATQPRIVDNPFVSVGVDHLSLGQGRGSLQILVLIDHFSKFVIAEVVESTKAEETVNTLLAMCMKYNITECCLRCDNAFQSAAFKETMEMMNIHVRYGIPYNSRSNTEVERANRTIREKMRIFDWGSDIHEVRLSLAIAVMEINATPIPGVEISPFEIIFGHTPRPFLGQEIPKYRFRNLSHFVEQKYERLWELQDLLRKYYETKTEPQNELNGKKLYKVGQVVRVLSRPKKGQSKQQFLRYSPETYVIKEVRRASSSYLLELLDHRPRQKLRIILHHRRIKPVFHRTRIEPMAEEPEKVREEIETIINGQGERGVVPGLPNQAEKSKRVRRKPDRLGISDYVCSL